MKSKRFYGESNPDHVRDRDTFLPLNYRIRWDLHNRPRKEIEDEVLAIELKIRKDTLGVIDGGKA